MSQYAMRKSSRASANSLESTRNVRASATSNCLGSKQVKPLEWGPLPAAYTPAGPVRRSASPAEETPWKAQKRLAAAATQALEPKWSSGLATPSSGHVTPAMASVNNLHLQGQHYSLNPPTGGVVMHPRDTVNTALNAANNTLLPGHGTHLYHYGGDFVPGGFPSRPVHPLSASSSRPRDSYSSALSYPSASPSQMIRQYSRAGTAVTEAATATAQSHPAVPSMVGPPVAADTDTRSESSPPPVLVSRGSSAVKKRLKSSSVVQPSSPLFMAHYTSPPGSDIGGVQDDIKEDPFEVPFSVVRSSLRGRKPAGRCGVAKKSNLSEVSLSTAAIMSAEN